MKDFMAQAFAGGESPLWTDVTSELVREMIRDAICRGAEQEGMDKKQHWIITHSCSPKKYTYNHSHTDEGAGGGGSSTIVGCGGAGE